MSTRGLIIVRQPFENGDNDSYATAIYNHQDSYPTMLGRHLFNIFSECNSEEEAMDRICEMGDDSRPIHFNWEAKDLSDNNKIDYLFHEWVYTVDMLEYEFAGYATVWLDSPDLPGESDEHRGTVVEAFHTGMNETLSGEELEQVQNDAKDEAKRTRSETLYGVNKSHYDEVLGLITEEAEDLGMETVKTLTTHDRTEATIQIPKPDLYVKLMARQLAPRGEERRHEVTLMFGTTPTALSGSIKYEVRNIDRNEFREILEKTRNGEAGKDFLEWRMDQNLPGIGEELAKRLAAA